MALEDDDTTRRAIARYRSLDPYVLWRALKDLDNEIYSIERAKARIPRGMLRMRAAMLKAREKGTIILSSAIANPPNAPFRKKNLRPFSFDFDPSGFVDRYSSLGGMRRAIVWDQHVCVFGWNEDTREAAEFWDQQFPALSRDQQQAVAACLLERARS